MLVGECQEGRHIRTLLGLLTWSGCMFLFSANDLPASNRHCTVDAQGFISGPSYAASLCGLWNKSIHENWQRCCRLFDGIAWQQRRPGHQGTEALQRVAEIYIQVLQMMMIAWRHSWSRIARLVARLDTDSTDALSWPTIPGDPCISSCPRSWDPNIVWVTWLHDFHILLTIKCVIPPRSRQIPLRVSLNIQMRDYRRWEVLLL
jgi:hypothetical protein